MRVRSHTSASPVWAVSSAVTLPPGLHTLAISTPKLRVPALVWAVPLVLPAWTVSDRVTQLGGGDTHPGPGAAELPGGARDEGQAGGDGGAVQLV